MGINFGRWGRCGNGLLGKEQFRLIAPRVHQVQATIAKRSHDVTLRTLHLLNALGVVPKFNERFLHRVFSVLRILQQRERHFVEARRKAHILFFKFF